MERNLIGKQIQKYREQSGLDTLLSLSEALNVSIDILLGNRSAPIFPVKP